MLLIVLSMLAALYLLVLASIRLGWNRIQKNHPPLKQAPSVTIIIAARNEAAQLPRLLTSLTLQSYPLDRMEVLLVDDHSEDETSAVAKAYQDQLNLRILELKTGEGKMAALELAIGEAQHERLLFTDADVSLPPQWVEQMVRAAKEADWVSGVVAINLDRSFLSTFQAYDMAGMMAVTGASFGWNLPGLANGANMLIRKSILQSPPYQAHPGGAGDDVFLLEHITRQQATTRFQPSAHAVVLTDPQPSLSALLRQRQRWASKSIYLKNPFIWLVMITGVWANLWVIVLAIWSFFQPLAFMLFIFLFTSKIILEGIAIYPILKRSRQEEGFIWRHFSVALCYPVYIISAAFLGIFVPYKWKGRTHQWRK